jgi:hypothetical protein
VDDLTTEDATLELNFDLRRGNTCGQKHELHTNIGSDGTMAAWTEDPCGSLDPFPLPGVLVSWGSVLEVQIPRASLGEYDYARPVFLNLWTTVEAKWDSADTME